MQRFFTSMQACIGKEEKPFRMDNKPDVQAEQSFSCQMRYFPGTFPDELHETSRAMQSSRRPRL